MEGRICSMFLLALLYLVSNVGKVWAESQYEEVGPYIVKTFHTPRVHNILDVSMLCGLVVDSAPRPSQESSYESPPANIFIATPANTSGTFPVILFKHGTEIANCLYSTLLSHVASYGYIVVAPQYPHLIVDFDCIDEVEETIHVVNWVQDNLQILLNATLGEDQNIVPDVKKIVMSGHSRGGKVAYAVAMNQTTSISYSGLMLLDPVDGFRKSYKPAILNHTKINLSFPVLIEGTGYGSEHALIPIACAPKDYGHDAYYNVTFAPSVYHIVASEYGHMDFLDDVDKISWLFCKCGESKAPFRKFTGGLMVAFLENVFRGSHAPLVDVVNKASIQFDEIQYKSTNNHHISNILYSGGEKDFHLYLK